MAKLILTVCVCSTKDPVQNNKILWKGLYLCTFLICWVLGWLWRRSVSVSPESYPPPPQLRLKNRLISWLGRRSASVSPESYPPPPPQLRLKNRLINWLWRRSAASVSPESNHPLPPLRQIYFFGGWGGDSNLRTKSQVSSTLYVDHREKIEAFKRLNCKSFVFLWAKI